MIRSLPKSVIPLALFMLLVPVASALETNEWADDNYNPSHNGPYCPTTSGTRGCVPIEHLCTEGAPPQVVDLTLHCTMQASERSPAFVEWLATYWAPYYSYAMAEEGTTTVNYYAILAVATANGILEDTREERQGVDDVLCGQIWSFFCTQPVATAFDDYYLHVEDPMGPYPGP